MMSYLISTSDPEPVEDGYVDVCSTSHHQNIADSYVEVHGCVLEHLHWRSQ